MTKQKDLVELNQLRRFVDKILDISGWPILGDIDAFDFQDACVEFGILVPEDRHSPCSSIEGECQCMEYYGSEEFEEGITCYRRKFHAKENKKQS